MNEKYELTEEFKEIETLREGWLQKIKVYRIRALRAFADVKIGDLGGFVETKQNLSNMGDAWVYGNAKVCNNARVYGNAEVCGDAKVCDNANIFWCSSIGSRHATTTMFRNKDNGITVTCGCFMGTLEEFAAIVEKEHGENIFGKEYKLLIELAKIHFGLQDETKGEEENGI